MSQYGTDYTIGDDACFQKPSDTPEKLRRALIKDTHKEHIL